MMASLLKVSRHASHDYSCVYRYRNLISCCNTLLLAGHDRPLQASDKQGDVPLETCVQVYRHTETTSHFQRDKAMHNAAQAANGVNSLFLAQPIGREDGPENIDRLLLQSVHLLIGSIS